jgi:hypothetical protein
MCIGSKSASGSIATYCLVIASVSFAYDPTFAQKSGISNRSNGLKPFKFRTKFLEFQNSAEYFRAYNIGDSSTAMVHTAPMVAFVSA